MTVSILINEMTHKFREQIQKCTREISFVLQNCQRRYKSSQKWREWLITEASSSDDWWLHFIQKWRLLKVSQQWAYQLMRWCANLENVLTTEASSSDSWWLHFVWKWRLLKASQQWAYQLMRWCANLESRFRSVQERTEVYKREIFIFLSKC